MVKYKRIGNIYFHFQLQGSTEVKEMEGYLGMGTPQRPSEFGLIGNGNIYAIGYETSAFNRREKMMKGANEWVMVKSPEGRNSRRKKG